MTPAGLFDESLVTAEWFDDTIQAWFSDDLISNAAAGISQSLAITLDGVSVSVTQALQHSQTLAIGLDDVSSNVTQTLTHDASLAITLDSVTVAVNQYKTQSQSVAIVLDDVTSAASQAAIHPQSLSITLDDVTVAVTQSKTGENAQSLAFTLDDILVSITQNNSAVVADIEVGVSRSRARSRTVYVEVNKKTYPVKEDQVIEFLNKLKQPEQNQEKVKTNVNTVYKIRNKQTKIVIKDAPQDFVMPQKTDYSNAIIELKFRQAMQRYQQDMEDEEFLLLL